MATDNPAMSVERWAAAGHQRVDVRVVVEPLVSRVEHELRGWLELAAAAKRFI